jgi:hypothetical protein
MPVQGTKKTKPKAREPSRNERGLPFAAGFRVFGASDAVPCPRQGGLGAVFVVS